MPAVSKNRILSYNDKAVFAFSILFILTTTNSIFLNQIGYYGALLCLLLRFVLTKENPFSKTGLETVFVLFILAEILSTIFSLDINEAAFFSLKKFLLIPTLYVFAAAAEDLKKVKQFILIYITATTLTLIYYLIRSFEYYANNLYQVKASGPSVFQYPITSSELMSFSVVILFAFLVNEKCKLKTKLFIALIFAINLLALIATYKRTGWIGAAAGILFVLVLSRKWILLTALALAGGVLILLSKTISQINFYEISDSTLTKTAVLNTEGIAYNILPIENGIFVSDFNNGLLLIQDTLIKQKYSFPSPIVALKKWEENFYLAYLSDTRFILIRFDSEQKILSSNEFYTPGLPLNHKIVNKFLYVLDEDSSLMIYNNPNNLSDISYFRPKFFNKLHDFIIDSSNCIFINDDKSIEVYALQNYFPSLLLFEDTLAKTDEPIEILNNQLYVNGEEGLKIFSLGVNRLNLIQIFEGVKAIKNILPEKDRLFALSSEGKLFEFEYRINDSLKLKRSYQLKPIPNSISILENKLYTAYNKTDRFSSFVDPHYSSNMTRISLWRAGLNMFLDYPFLGVGDIDLAKLYRKYKRPWDREIQGHLHNNYIHTLATLGAIGFAAFIFLLIKIFLLHLSLVKKMKGIPIASSYSMGALGAYISFLAAGLTEYNFGDHEVITLVWFTLALSIAFSKAAKLESK